MSSCATALATACAAVSLAIAGCATHTDPVQVGQPADKPTVLATLGVLDAVYDRSKWAWITNVDGRPLLRHTEVPQCYLDPDPPPHFHEPEFRLERQAKTFGTTRYDVILAFEGRDFWEAVYLPASSGVPILGVYAPGPCQQEAERILEAYEEQRHRYVEKQP